MTAILIVAHAPLASALKAVVAHLDAELEAQVDALDIGAGTCPDEVEAQARRLIERRGGGEALVLLDVAYATPCNGVGRLLDDPSLRVEVLTGVNVPMLWRALCYRALPLSELLIKAADGAQAGVVHVTRSNCQRTNPGPTTDAADPDQDQQ